MKCFRRTGKRSRHTGDSEELNPTVQSQNKGYGRTRAVGS